MRTALTPDAFFRSEVETKPGFTRFWSENQSSFDEPFRSYAAHEFAKKPAPPPVA
jgi:hypothetical protein